MHSSHVHTHSYGSYNEALAAEPTNTLTIRRTYARKLRGQLDEIRDVATEAIVDDDIFHITDARVLSTGVPRDVAIDALEVERPGDFDFRTNSEKIRGFRTWLRNQLNDNILEPHGRGGNEYLERAYERGIKDANRDLKRAGWISAGDAPPIEAVTRRALHKDALETIYTRNYRQLEGLTNSIDSDLSRVLADGLVSGSNPNEIANDVADIIGKGGASGTSGAEARATMIARTEVQNAHAEAAAGRYKELGVEQARLVLAANACSTCQALARASPMPVDELRKRVPVHPQCKCALAPVSNS